MEDEGKTEKLSYKDKLRFANEISKPMAPKSFTKKLLKLVKKGNNNNLHLFVQLFLYN